jgi:hypothetical protein
MWRLPEPGSLPDTPEDSLVDVVVVLALEPLAPAPAPLVVEVVVPATLAEGEEELPQALRKSAPSTAARIGNRRVRSRAT